MPNEYSMRCFCHYCRCCYYKCFRRNRIYARFVHHSNLKMHASGTAAATTTTMKKKNHKAIFGFKKVHCEWRRRQRSADVPAPKREIDRTHTHAVHTNRRQKTWKTDYYYVSMLSCAPTFIEIHRLIIHSTYCRRQLLVDRIYNLFQL